MSEQKFEIAHLLFIKHKVEHTKNLDLYSNCDVYIYTTTTMLVLCKILGSRVLNLEQSFQIQVSILTLLPISVTTQRFILSAIDSFALALAISLTTRKFLPSGRSFPPSISLEESLR